MAAPENVPAGAKGPAVEAVLLYELITGGIGHGASRVAGCGLAMFCLVAERILKGVS